MKHQPIVAESAAPSHRSRRAGLAKTISFAGIGLALLLGIQLGALHWRYRREIWRLQGLAVGCAIGFVVGRLGRSSAKADGRPAGSN